MRAEVEGPANQPVAVLPLEPFDHEISPTRLSPKEIRCCPFAFQSAPQRTNPLLPCSPLFVIPASNPRLPLSLPHTRRRSPGAHPSRLCPTRWVGRKPHTPERTHIARRALLKPECPVSPPVCHPRRGSAFALLFVIPQRSGGICCCRYLSCSSATQLCFQHS
jgi:hypothetical protein